MKKLVILGLLSVSLASAKVFVGVDGGYSIGGAAGSGKVDSTAYNSSAWKNPADLWSVGANIGYQGGEGFFGYRAFVSFDFSQFINTKTKGDYYDVALNLDALLNFVNTGSFSFGLFLGAGAGYQFVYDGGNGINNIPVFGRAGLGFGFGEHLRLDLTAKLPIVGWNLDSKTGISGVHAPITFQAGLKYLF